MARRGQKREWPAPLGEAAYHGVIGDYVKKVTPHSESDPAAILIQTLVCFGNAAGRNPHFYVEDDRHGCLLHAVIVGSTGAGRKGTSLGRARALPAQADLDWGQRNSGEGGLSSAEGLISAVRDPAGQDPGVTDKRLLAAMGEFGETLERMRNEGNTLGQVVRNAWDLKSLRTRTRSPLVATNPFISVIGHITEEELKTLH